MCELLALNFNQPVMPDISFRAFRHRGMENPDGWGLAYYADESAQVFKECENAEKSFLSDFLRNYSSVKSPIMIGHVRRATAGVVCRRNTHPFSREISGKEYVFAHNGTLSGDYRGQLGVNRFRPIGDTDSEHAFCCLLEEITQLNVSDWAMGDYRWIWEQLRRINSFGEFNCLFSDGRVLFAYHDMNGFNGLSYLRREAPFGTIHLVDEDLTVQITEEHTAEKGFVVATRPLTDEQWKAFGHGELIVFRDGEIVFSSSEQA